MKKFVVILICLLLINTAFALVPEWTAHVTLNITDGSARYWNQKIISQLSTIRTLLDEKYVNDINYIVDDVLLFADTEEWVNNILLPHKGFTEDYSLFALILGVETALMSIGSKLWLDAAARSFLKGIPSANTYKVLLGGDEGIGPAVQSMIYKLGHLKLKALLPTYSDVELLDRMQSRQDLMSEFLGDVSAAVSSGNPVSRQDVLDLFNQGLVTSNIRNQIRDGIDAVSQTVSSATISDEVGSYISGYLSDIIMELRQIIYGQRQTLIVGQYMTALHPLKDGKEALQYMKDTFEAKAALSIGLKYAGATVSVGGSVISTAGIAVALTGAGAPAGLPLAFIGLVWSLAGAATSLVGTFMETIAANDLVAINSHLATQLTEFSFVENALPTIVQILADSIEDDLTTPISIPEGFISNIQPNNDVDGGPAFDVTFVNTGTIEASGYVTFNAYTSQGVTLAAVPSFVEFTVGSGSSAETTVPVPSFDSGLFGGVYVLRVELWIGPSLQPEIYQTTYNVGLLGAISDFGSQLTSAISSVCQAICTVVEGTIAQGQEIVSGFASAVGAAWDSFILSFGGSQVDLHIYDSMGNHVGTNYGTGEFEAQIPESQYSGTQSIPQWIRVPPGEYTVKVIGIDVEESERYIVTAIETLQSPSILRVFPTSFNETVLAGSTYELFLSVAEIGGQNVLSNIEILGSNLAGSTGIILAPPQPAVTDLDPGSSMLQSLTYSVSLNASGTFTGTIAVSADGFAPDSSSLNLTAEIPVTFNVVRTPDTQPEPFPVWIAAIVLIAAVLGIAVYLLKTRGKN